MKIKIPLPQHLLVNVGLIGLLIVQLVFSADRFTAAIRAVVVSPLSPEPHLLLAELATEQSDWGLAAREYSLALSLLKRRLAATDSRILDYQARVAAKVSLKQRVQEEIVYWSEVLREQPTYRDAWLRLAALFSQVSEDNLAFSSWKRALEIDPNHEETVQLGKVLGAQSR